MASVYPQVSNKMALIVELDKLQCDHHIIMAQSTENYVRRGKVSITRKIPYYFNILIQMTYVIKWYLASGYSEDSLFVTEGEFVHLVFDGEIVYKGLFLLAVVTFVLFLGLRHMELTHQLFHLDVIWKLANDEAGYGLTKIYHDRFSFNINWIVKATYFCINYCISPSNIFFITIFAIATFYFDRVEHNLILLIINCFGVFLWCRRAIYTIFTLMIYVYLVVAYVRFKFQIIIDMILANTLMLNKAIHHYEITYMILNKLSKPFNILMSYLYLIYPIYFVTNFNTAIDGNTSLIGSFVLILILLLNVFINYIIFASISSLSIKKDQILESLYPILTEKNIIGFRLRLRIDSFIARVNTEFIGFHCLNYIKFERKAFCSYIIGLSSTYILFKKCQLYLLPESD